MNRPKRKNAVNNQLYIDMVAALKEAAENDAVHAVVVTGAGEYFTSGADVGAGDFQGGEDLTKAPVGVFMQAVIKFPKLLVAAVNGPAIGIGVTFLPHCDVVFASTTATFWTPFARIAVVPEFCSSLLFPMIMGVSRANEMLMLGKQFSAQEAKAAGLVSEVLAPADLLPHVYKVMQSALQYPLAPKSLRMFKGLIKFDAYQDLLMKVFRIEMEALRERADNGDIFTAVAALLEAKSAAKAKL